MQLTKVTTVFAANSSATISLGVGGQEVKPIATATVRELCEWLPGFYSHKKIKGRKRLIARAKQMLKLFIRSRFKGHQVMYGGNKTGKTLSVASYMEWLFGKRVKPKWRKKNAN